MPLKAVKPKHIEKRLKILLFGEAGAGKTTAAIHFPRPIIIDTERGCEQSEYSALLDKQEGAIYQTADFNEIRNEIKALLCENHPYKTLIIDPITIVWDELVNAAERKMDAKFGRHFALANKQFKELMNLILRLDMNVIFTAHTKDKYDEKMTVTDTVADGYKKLPYFFDLVLEIKIINNQRMACVRKSRIANFKSLEIFPFSYDLVADKYGREILERDAVPEQLVSAEQVIELRELIKIHKVCNDAVNITLDRANAANFDELPADKAEQWINFLKKNEA